MYNTFPIFKNCNFLNTYALCELLFAKRKACYLPQPCQLVVTSNCKCEFNPFVKFLQVHTQCDVIYDDNCEKGQNSNLKFHL